MTEYYKIYTIPTCDTCYEAKELMKSKGINYSEVNLATSEGKKEFGKVYFSIDSKLKRDEHKMAILPILLKIKEENSAMTIEEICQGEDVKALF